MAEQNEKIESAGAFTTYPLVDEEREWSFFEFTWVNVGLAIATWAFLIGGTTALFVGVMTVSPQSSLATLSGWAL